MSSILGHPVLRREDPRFLTGQGEFVANLVPPGAAHVVYVTSTEPHARLLAVDVADAVAAPGVLGVFTAADVDPEVLVYPPPFPGMNDQMARTMLAQEVVRYVGEPVVAVVADDPVRAADAAEVVVVDYDPRPPLVDLEASLRQDVVLFDDIEDQTVYRCAAGESPEFDDCEVVVRARFHNQRMSAAPIEARTGFSYWEGGRLVHHTATQGSHNVKASLMGIYGLDPEQVLVVTPDVGGSFGAKFRCYPEEAFLGWLARRLGRPCAWAETRTQSMTGLGSGRGQIQDVVVGGTRDGRIAAYQLGVIQDSGAYPLIAGFLPRMTMAMFTGVYDIASAGYEAVSVPTSTTPNGAFRGAGRPEASTAIERAVDLFAAEVEMDPAEVRRRNFLDPEGFPHTTVSGVSYDSGDYAKALAVALEAANYDDLRAEQAARRANGSAALLGIGLSTYVEVTATTGAGDFASVELGIDGTVRAVTSSTPHGQGHETVWPMIVADVLGIDMDRVVAVGGDTDCTPRGQVTGGSRSAQIVGSMLFDASQRLVAQVLPTAADLLEASVADVVHDSVGGCFHVAGTPAVSVRWAEVAAALDGPMNAESDFETGGQTFPFGAHVAVVEVDAETGRVELVRLVAVDDAGTVLNPLIFEGQIHGGIAGGVAQALLEEVAYDADANPLTTNFADYAVITAAELPSFELIRSETPTDRNLLGAKGVGESGTVGATAAVQNAVVDALAPFGVRHLDMPLTPERVWKAVQSHG
ncbi:MAG: xanthine dehydrogenase family protein molybdopterin-binding subunit [Acidimicrobiia bacterium]|nr:xanthine dehydrogenase family protein molybdopterin-binding subunit [Acidimicrobiia bacterium]MCY4432288.1 xanthine dehydrogenase family protein molybdopterin-binding subunit [bacterium]